MISFLTILEAGGSRHCYIGHLVKAISCIQNGTSLMPLGRGKTVLPRGGKDRGQLGCTLGEACFIRALMRSRNVLITFYTITLVIKCQSLNFGGILSHSRCKCVEALEKALPAVSSSWGRATQPHHLRKPLNVFLWNYCFGSGRLRSWLLNLPGLSSHVEH